MAARDVWNRDKGPASVGCGLAGVGGEECKLNVEDRAVVDRIDANSRETNKVVRALSVSLIGRVNGETVDEQGGRIGRLEADVRELQNWRWYMLSSLIALLLSGVGYLINEYIHKGIK